MTIKPLSPAFFKQVIDFTNQYIGNNYFSEEDLEKILKFSTLKTLNSSLLALQDTELIGVRLTYMPGLWVSNPDLTIAPDLWQVDKERVGYFKSLFVKPQYQSQGVGVKLSSTSLAILKKVKTQAVVTHSWVESPNNSSLNYLTKMGFKEVRDIKNAWSHIDYDCVRCTPKRCYCTAKEMILKLTEGT